MSNEPIIVPRIDAYVVAFDECADYTIDPIHQLFIEQTRGIYLLDRNRTMYIDCETKYLLIHLYDQIIPTKHWELLDPEQQEILHNAYECASGSDKQVQIDKIDTLIARNHSEEVYHFGNPRFTGGSKSTEELDYDERITAIQCSCCEDSPL